MTIFLKLVKTPWSWGRMDDIISEGRKIESCRQLNEKIAIASDRKTKIELNWKRNKSTSMPARERPLTRVRARSEKLNLKTFNLDSIRKFLRREKETRFEGLKKDVN